MYNAWVTTPNTWDRLRPHGQNAEGSLFHCGPRGPSTDSGKLKKKEKKKAVSTFKFKI